MKEYKLVQFDGSVNEGEGQVGENGGTGYVEGNFGGVAGGIAGGVAGGVFGNEQGGQEGGTAGNVFKTFGTDGQTGNIVEQAGPASKVFGEVTINEAGNPEFLPKKIGLWGKVKNFLFQEIDLTQEIVIELTPKEKKVLKEVHDFWFQEVKLSSVRDFLFQDINIFGRRK